MYAATRFERTIRICGRILSRRSEASVGGVVLTHTDAIIDDAAQPYEENPGQTAQCRKTTTAMAMMVDDMQPWYFGSRLPSPLERRTVQHPGRLFLQGMCNRYGTGRIVSLGSIRVTNHQIICNMGGGPGLAQDIIDSSARTLQLGNCESRTLASGAEGQNPRHHRPGQSGLCNSVQCNAAHPSPPRSDDISGGWAGRRKRRAVEKMKMRRARCQQRKKMGRPGTGDEKDELTIEMRYFQTGLAQEPGITCRCPMGVAAVDHLSCLGVAC